MKKCWHSEAEMEEMWLKHNSIWGQSQAATRFLLFVETTSSVAAECGRLKLKK